jgi:magnesium and cobalt transporter
MNKPNIKKTSIFSKIKNLIRPKPINIHQFINNLREAKDHGVINTNTLDMIEGVLSVNEKQARDIMIPKLKMITINGSAKPQETLDAIIKSGHSRFPVTINDNDKITGILLAKDLLKILTTNPQKTPNIQKICRPATRVPESKRLNILLKEFRKNRNHMAIVINEYGQTAGLVTIEDVLEEIVGEISDEYDDQEQSFITRKNNKTFIVQADTPILELNEYFHTTFEPDNFDTVGGLMLKKFSYVPKVKESITLDNIFFKITKANSRGIQEITVTLEVEL